MTQTVLDRVLLECVESDGRLFGGVQTGGQLLLLRLQQVHIDARLLGRRLARVIGRSLHLCQVRISGSGVRL